MDLQRRGDKNMLGQPIDWCRMRQNGAYHRGPIGGSSGLDALQRDPRGIGHRHRLGHCGEALPHAVHGGVRGETRTVERRHAVLARTRKRVGGRRHDVRQTLLHTMLHVAELGKKQQIGAQGVPIGERFQPPAAAGENRQRIGQLRKGRLNHLPDRDRVKPLRAYFSHTRISRTARAT